MRHALPTLLVLLLLAAPAGAQIYNGFFEIPGGAGWTVTQPTTGWLYFETSGGNPDGYATVRIAATGPVDVSCISQVFECGSEPGGVCNISFDFSLLSEIFIVGGGEVRAYIDGVLSYVSASIDQDWTTVELAVPCGVHEITLCLELSVPDEQYVACFDNVTAACDGGVPAESLDWSTVKTLY